ncbi:hypothetical protein GOB94_05760 [Granulicella sp. 5B5]|uniref:hypothetical protein n=1 Tax=Granulicella sp. 5B5 TaxID=1617967 RepID=UPI0015F5BE74|nr:hypothetical protein [Granulicella sp. 5B5]QMV18250.1 hypothetical protein GOB94_05760 [Granulicella sp. 5B5]
MFSRSLTLAFCFVVLAPALPAVAQQSAWAHLGPHGDLVYKTTPRGDRIPDFSYAGYMAGGVALPTAPVAETLNPSGSDDTAALQAALDRTAKAAARSNHPVALLLAPGDFHLSTTIELRGSNVVLRGSGADKTTLTLTGEPHLGLRVGPASAAGEPEGRLDPKLPSTQASTTLAPDIYVPNGSLSVRVVNARLFHPGDTVLINRPVTPAWLHFMQMDNLIRRGKPEHWVGANLPTERTLAAVHGNTLTFTSPLMDDYDPAYGGGTQTTVARIATPVRIQQVGIESLHIVAPPRRIALGNPAFDAITLTATQDAWVRDIRIDDTTTSITITDTSQRITIDRVDVVDSVTVTTPAKPFGFSLGGTQTLVMRSSITGDKIFFAATQARNQGPNVLLHCTFKGDTALEPHQRWATGLLVDNVTVHDGAINLYNRGEMGSGHGWAIAWSVVWNSSADTITVQSPPGTINWDIGTTGERVLRPMPVFDNQPKGPDIPQGTVDSPGHPVIPDSLYLQQLRDRLGEKAVHAIGW